MAARDEFSTDPEENVGNQSILAIPYDENNHRPAVLYGAIVENGEIVGFLPVRCTDNGDGTCSIDVT